MDSTIRASRAPAFRLSFRAEQSCSVRHIGSRFRKPHQVVRLRSGCSALPTTFPGRLRRVSSAMSSEVTPFRIEVPDAELRDLRERLARTRWPEREPVDDWSQGVPLDYLQELCAYWGDGYDWRATEDRLNALP